MASPASGRGQLDYDDLVATYATAADRVCRDWLERAVAERLQRPGCRYVLVVAEPGAGKTGRRCSLPTARGRGPAAGPADRPGGIRRGCPG